MNTIKFIGLAAAFSLSFCFALPAFAERVGKNETKEEKANLDAFDRLDFDAYSKKKDMKLFEKLHCPNVKVVFPDGRETHGIAEHLKDIELFFNGTPDARITSHPIAFGSGDWTVATGVMEATFSEPMKMPDGKTIPANGNKVKMPMATIAKWNNGCIAEEHLFYDNAEYMRQVSLKK